jgi:addiction module HigA family antidote
MEAPTMSGSRTTTVDSDRLDNVHPGDVLRHDFLIGTDIALAEVAEGAGIDRDRLTSLLDGRMAVDADIDARLARYFGMTHGFFLRLQNAYDLEEVYRDHGDELDRIVPRAA